MADKIAKAYEMTDAKITFVSLVDKAANKKQFLITKAADGNAQFQTYGRILKSDAKAHYVTGIVYEPMEEDTQGNYMTEEEITKAAHWFAKNGNQVDLQHSFQPLAGACVVESSVAKCDYELDGQAIKKGTWLMTVELTAPELFEAIEKGELTGFSMGGMGKYSQEDVTLSKTEETLSKTEDLSGRTEQEKKGILKRLAGLFGMEMVEKGQVKDHYMERITSENFWSAFYALQDVLFRWNVYEDKRIAEAEPEAVQEALADFHEIVTGLLSNPNTIEKSVAGICKAGKKMSHANRDMLKDIHDRLGEFLAKFNDEEETDVTKTEIEEIVKIAVAESMDKTHAAGHEETQKKKQDVPKDEEVTKADIQKMIDTAIQKAIQPEAEERQEAEKQQEAGKGSLEDAVTKAVSQAMEPFLKQAGLPTNLNHTTMQKSAEEPHYLHGIL